MKSEHVKDEHEEYWLCECGVARVDIESMEEHCKDDNHYAEKVNAEEGTVIGFLALGLNDEKYGSQVPPTANVKREANKNDPIFQR